METKHIFHVQGMHCKACTLLIEDALGKLPGVVSVHAHLGENTVMVTGNFEDNDTAKLAEKFTLPIQDHGYTLSVEKNGLRTVTRDFTYALPIAALFIGAFILIQKSGIVHWVNGSELGYGAIFLIGVIASLSTCMAVVGGLVLSLSASFAKGGDAVRPQSLFHIGRLVAFFILGGVIGTVGTAFTLSAMATFILNFIIGVVMLILGLNLLDIFTHTRRFQFSLPAIFGRHVRELTTMNHTLTPLLVGIATFFLPCGFTQSMQLYTLSSGGFVAGALTMFVFALGTLPVLAAMSFSSLSVAKSPHAGVFYKTAGLIVIAFALMSIINSFVVAGFIAPVFNF